MRTAGHVRAVRRAGRAGRSGAASPASTTGLSRLDHGLRHAQGFGVRAHVVHAHHGGSPSETEHGGDHGTCFALPRLGPQQGADEALARGAQHDRTAKGGDAVEVGQQQEIVLERLAEADAGVEQDLCLAHAGGKRRRHALLEEDDDLADHVVVAGIDLHRPRLAEHVHETHRTAALGYERRHVGVAAQRRDVVDDGGAGVERGASHGGLGRVDGDGGRRAGRQPLDHRHDARQFIGDRHRLGAGPGRLAPDVEDRRALGGQQQAVRHGGVGVGVQATVGKRIGGHVDDAHDAGQVDGQICGGKAHLRPLEAVDLSGSGRP